MAKLPLLSMLVPKRVFVHRNKIFLDEVHVDLENVPSQIICATEASRLEKLTPYYLDFWGINYPEKTLIQSKICENSALEESIMQKNNERYDSAIYEASKKPLIGRLSTQYRQKSYSSQPLPRQDNRERSAGMDCFMI